MKNKIIITAFAVLTIAGVYTLSQNMEMDINDAIAGTVQMPLTTINSTCTGSTAAGFFVTDIAAILGAATTVVSTQPTYAPGTASLTGGVDGETLVAGTDAYNLGTPGLTGITGGRALFNVQGPNAKVGGFQCTLITSAGFKIKQAETIDDADLSVTIDDFDLTDVAYDGAAFDDSATDIIIFGTGGQSGVNVTDVGDRKGVEEGEVSFGGTGVPSTGGYMFQFSQDIANRTAGTVDSEVVIVTMEY